MSLCLRLREYLNLVNIYVKELITCTYHFLRFFFLSSSLLELLEDDDSSSEDDEESDDDSACACANSSAYFFSIRSLGASLRNWRRSSVSAPRPILVKKFMLNRAFCTESRGNTAPRCCYTVSSWSFLVRDSSPRFSARSWKSILMKMRELEVVSSSVRRMADRHDQSTPLV